MRGEWNDYLLLARHYLRQYQELRMQAEEWSRGMARIRAELATVPVAISRYGDDPGGGQGELSEVERLAERRMGLEARLSEHEADVASVERLLSRIDSALDAIGTIDAEAEKLVRAHYICGATWYELADSHGCSYDSMRQKGRRALHALVKVLFGQKAFPGHRVVLVA